MRAAPFALGVGFWLLAGAFGSARAQQAADLSALKSFANAQQPQLAVGPSGTVALVFGDKGRIFCSTSSDGGKTFAEPVKVGDVAALALGMRRGPRVAVTAKTLVVTAIGGKVGKGRDGDLLAWHSHDGGTTWRGPTRVNSVPGAAREGLHQLAAASDGTLSCVWLDLRHDRMQVYGASSTDGGSHWRDEKLVYESPDGSVCTCCQPQAVYDAKGTLHVMWRNDLADARDMYLARSTDHGKTFGPAAKLGLGRWPLNSCPMDGGGLAQGGTGPLTTVWRRHKELFRCVPGQPEVALGSGEQGWAAATPNGVALVWIVQRPGAVMALLPGASQAKKLADHGSDPVVAGAVDGRGPVVAAWEEGSAGARRIRATVLLPRE